MAYLTQYDNARTVSFLKILEMAISHVAKDVAFEAATTPNHINRVILAQKVLEATANWAQAFKDPVAVQTITDASTDNEFYNAVLAVWNAMAGMIWNGAPA